jgi:phospholipid N-methyltransferase
MLALLYFKKYIDQPFSVSYFFSTVVPSSPSSSSKTSSVVLLQVDNITKSQTTKYIPPHMRSRSDLKIVEYYAGSSIFLK